MKKGWKLKTLKDIGKIFSGNSINAKIKKEKYLNQPEGLPYIATKDVSYDSSINYDNGVKIPFSKKELFRIAPKNSVLICAEGGSAGRKIGIINQDVCFVNKLFAISPDNETLSKYLFYWYKSDKFKTEFNSRLTGLIGGVSKKKFETIPIPFPENIEQEYIVKKLDICMEQIDKAIKNVEKNLQNAKDLFKSQLNEIFSQKGDGWQTKKMQELCEKITDGTHQTPKYFDQGVVFLSSKNVTSGKIDWENVKYIDNEQHIAMHKRIAPKINDILLAKNGTTGVAAMVDRDVVFDIYVSLAHIRVLDEVIPKYMLHYINSPLAKKQFNSRLKGVGVPNLHLKEIREVEVSFPISKLKQESIVTQLDGLKRQVDLVKIYYQKEIFALKELKQTILEKAFNGEL